VGIGEGVGGNGRGLICIWACAWSGWKTTKILKRESPGQNSNRVHSDYKPKRLPLEPAGTVRVFL